MNGIRKTVAAIAGSVDSTLLLEFDIFLTGSAA